MTKTKECRGEKRGLSFPPPWEFQTPISSLRAPDLFLLLRDPGLLVNLPRNWLSHIKSIPECCYNKSKEWFDFLQEIKRINQYLCSFFNLIKLCDTKALAWSSLVPGPEAKSSSSEITNLTEATGLCHMEEVEPGPWPQKQSHLVSRFKFSFGYPKGFPGGSEDKESAAMEETWVWSLGQEDALVKEWLPTPVLLLGEFHRQRSLVGYNPWVHKESDTTEQITLSLFWLS